MSDSLYEPGTKIRLSVTFTVSGAETDPTTTSLKVRDPAGATTIYAYPADIAKDAAGRFHMDLTPTAVGRYFYKWIATGTVVATREKSFRVARQVIP